ncbi:hypothetical protein TWF281_011131 [Arthrobotrys megalospora]
MFRTYTTNIGNRDSREDILKPGLHPGTKQHSPLEATKPLQSEKYNETQITRNESSEDYHVVKYTEPTSTDTHVAYLQLSKWVESFALSNRHLPSHPNAQYPGNTTQDVSECFCIPMLREDGKMHTPESLGGLIVEWSRRYGTIEFSIIDRVVDVAAMGLLAGGYIQDLSFRLLLAIGGSLDQYIWSTVDFEMGALNRTITLGEIIFHHTDISDPNWLRRARKLGANLRIRSECTESVKDIDRAIVLARLALLLGDDTSIDQAEVFEELGDLLSIRWKLKKEIGDIQSAIELVDRAQSLVQQSCPRKGIYLMKLENFLREKFQATDQMNDLNRAIQVTNECVETFMRAGDEKAHSAALYDLANHLRMRYEKIGRVEDINQAIDAMEKVSTVQIDDPVLRQSSLEDFGLLWYSKYDRTDNVKDLNRAIEQLELSISTTPSATTPHRRIVYHYLGVCYHARYGSNGLSSDLSRAVEMAKYAVQLPLEDQNVPDFSTYLFNLGSYSYQQFIFTAELADLQTAIESFEHALEISELVPDDRCIILSQLGDSLVMRYEIKRMADDLSKAESALKEAFEILEASPKYRAAAARSLANKFAAWGRWDESLAVFQKAVSLLAGLNSGLIESKERSEVEAFFGLSSSAAAAALNAGKSPLEALSLLERGRGLLSGNTIDTNTPDIKITESTNSLSSYDAYGALDTLGENRIAVINISKYRCDAILVAKSGISVVPLPLLDQEIIDEKSRILRGNGENSWGVLEWLWEVVASPILKEFGIEEPVSKIQTGGSGFKDKKKSQGTEMETQRSEDGLPHIWWIPTGQLSQFPIHAAGKHFERSGETVLDRVISSYAVSVKGLLQSRRRAPEKSCNTSGKALIVSMPKTPGQVPLFFAETEAKTVASICQSLNLETNTKFLPTGKDEILKQLQDCQIFHFAGHGLSDSTDPSQSCLLLEDWKESPLTVESLDGLNLHDNSPFLAYLSACSTGSNKIMTLCDESINLIGASQLAGFRHVIGSLWEVNDRQCVKVAKIVYETLAEKGLADSAVALGLHRASVTLRDEAIGKKSGLRARRQVARGVGTTSKLNSITIARPKSMDQDSELYPDITELPNWLNKDLKSYRSCPLRKGKGTRFTNTMDAIVSAPTEVTMVRRVPLEFEYDDPIGGISESGSVPGDGGTRAASSDKDGSQTMCENHGDFSRTAVPIKLKKPQFHWVPYVHFGV